MRGSTLGRAGIASEAEILDRADNVLGPITVLQDQSLRSQIGRVLRVQPRSGEPCLIKWYREKSDYQREADALTLYAPALGSAAPRLIHGDDAFRMLLITELRGETVAGSNWEWEPLIHFKAGEIVRRLHEASQMVESDQFAQHCASSFETNVLKIEHLVPEVTIAEMRAHVVRALDLPPVALVPAHRDNHPRNWIVEAGKNLKLQNFVMTEYDPWVVDVFALSQDHWRADPQLKLAFLSGYEREMDAQDSLILMAHHAVSVVKAMASSGRSSGNKSEKIKSQDLLDSLLGTTLF